MILVTGANGFIGRALCLRLLARNVPIRPVVRADATPFPLQPHVVGEIGPVTDWSAALEGIECIVHLAARVPTLTRTRMQALDAFRHTNVAGTRRLAEAAAAAGVRRFVFISSVKVHGDVSKTRISEEQTPQPVDPYGISKWEAEREIQRIAHSRGLEWVILRPPQVYGPGVRGNFPTLLGAVARGMPLPLGAIHNRRSLIYLGNLVDAIQRCIDCPEVANQVFLVSDDEQLSTPDLVRRLALALGTAPRLVPVPVWILRLVGALTGRGEAVERLTQSLEIDSSRFKEMARWTPPFAVDTGLADMARWFRSLGSG